MGARAAVRAAWVRFPTLAPELLEQTYTRLAADRYRYESAGGGFRRDLTVSDDGWVTNWLGNSAGSFTNNGANFSAFVQPNWQVQDPFL